MSSVPFASMDKEGFTALLVLLALPATLTTTQPTYYQVCGLLLFDGCGSAKRLQRALRTDQGTKVAITQRCVLCCGLCHWSCPPRLFFNGKTGFLIPCYINQVHCCDQHGASRRSDGACIMAFVRTPLFSCV